MTTWKYGVGKHDKIHASWLFYAFLAVLLFVAATAIGVRADNSANHGLDTTPVNSSSDLTTSAAQEASAAADDQEIESITPSSPSITADIHTSGGSSGQVTVNGTPVDIPEEGSTSQTIASDDGSNVSVSITNNSSSEENSRSKSKLKIKISSDSNFRERLDGKTTIEN